MSSTTRTVLFLLCCAALCPHPAEAGPVDFNRDVRPILSDKCFHCHGPDEKDRKGKLRLDTPEGAAKVLKGATPLESELYHRITTTDADDHMPPQNSNLSKPLTAQDLVVLKGWLESGGKYERHWAFQPPAQAPLPNVVDPLWSEHPIDRFVADRLRAEGLQPSPIADRPTLIRRLTLDLTGLPPTPAEVDAFVNDTRPNAYDLLVDRLLRSPHYGERMALLWMDLARYGDSSVYHADGPREMWAWRDEVIRSFNENEPFDQFTLEQLAGDLLPNATPQQKIASGFNRNNGTTDEGGAIAEEFRVEYVVDRVKTTSNTWLGLSMECCQCHDHKYDPITQREYYEFFAYFNNTKDTGLQTRNGNSAPMLSIQDPEAETKRAANRETCESLSSQIAANVDQQRHSKAFTDWLAQQNHAATSPLPPVASLKHYFPLDESAKEGLVRSLDGLIAPVEAKLTPAPHEPHPGLRFDGNLAPTFATGPDLERTQPFTFAAWVKLPAQGAGGALFCRMNNAQDFQGYDIGAEGRRPGLHLIHHWPDNALKVYTKKELTPDQWHHVVVSHDGSGKAAGIAIYVDGELQENQVSADSLTGSIANATPFRLGARSEGGKFRGDVADIALYDRKLSPEEVKFSSGDLLTALTSLPQEKRTPELQEMVFAHYLRSQQKENAGLLTRYAKALEAGKKLADGMSSVMIMEDLPASQTRKTYVLNRGQYDQPKKDQEVITGVPAALPALDPKAPANRLGLAQWLIRPDHPLTSRVTVNRFWQVFFGEGLVRTSEDFGKQGEMPSHPALLDWLAVDFMQHGWNVKRLVRLIVTSATYRQDSRVSPLLRERDPENRLLARGPRFRLQGEFVRDNALFVGGLLTPEIGGPSVRPYQPPGIWEEVAIDTNLSKFVQDTGDKLFRRSMYTFWKRSSPQPSMMIFDAPTREKCTGRRSRTNTPLQALVTLNDPQFVEAARAFAQRILLQGGVDSEARIRFAMKTAVGRDASTKEIAILTKLHDAELTHFQSDAAKAETLLKTGESPRDTSLPPAEHAAWTVVASTLLNMDEFLMKN